VNWSRCVLLLFVLAGCSRARRDPLPDLPQLVLWAWERPENLMFIVPRSTGVAFLAETITLTGDKLSNRPRLQPLRVPAETRLMAVVRIESRKPHQVPAAQVAGEVLRAMEWPRVRALQIDYDAPISERGFYRDLLTEIRHRLPPAVPLEMTALVSWCSGDDWLRGLPVVDAVPMFFRMGSNHHAVTEQLHEPLCRSSIGIATDEYFRGIPKHRRLFVFHPRAWTEADYRAILREQMK